MTAPDMTALVPRFILADVNGNALAAAIGKGLEIFCRTVGDGLDLILDESKMPAWRLDEMAEELGCAYDKEAELEWKRKWIADAWKNYLHLGTPGIIEEYLRAKLDGVECQEWWQYGAQAYHFRVTVFEKTPQKEQWAAGMVERLQNLRSVYDGMAEKTADEIHVRAAENYPALYTDKLAGTARYTGATDVYGG